MNATDKKIQTKTALLTAAEELFSERSYAAVSTRELTDKAGVNLGAIQYHFGSKANLYMETIRSIMTRQEDSCEIASFEFTAKTQAEAIREIYFFTRAFINETCHPSGPDACKMMHREVLGATADNQELFEVLVSTVTEEFYRPIDDQVIALVKLLVPDYNEQQINLFIHSYYGQCIYYSMDRPFIEKLRGEDYAVEPMLTTVCEYIFTFSLRGLGFSEETIQNSLNQIKQELEN